MDTKVICLTPVKNEEWIIEKFLNATSLWADYIIIADQGSTDRTVEIAKKFEKVIIVDNSDLEDFNEVKMRTPLYEEARKISGKKLLISLDADEILTPNFESPEWKTILAAKEGTRFLFDLCNILPGFENYFFTMDKFCCAFIDDGSEYNMGLIHIPRIPIPNKCNFIKLNEIKVLHLQFVLWERMERKQLWYKMYERINFPNKSRLSLYRQYDYVLENIAKKQYKCDEFWVKEYSKKNIDITSVNIIPEYIWDHTILNYLEKYGFSKFKYLGLDKLYWKQRLRDERGISILDCKRSIFESLILKYLEKTRTIRDEIWVRAIDKFLKIFI